MTDYSNGQFTPEQWRKMRGNQCAFCTKLDCIQNGCQRERKELKTFVEIMDRHLGYLEDAVTKWHVERLVPDTSPMKIAWDKYKDTPNYQNTRRWALLEAHVDGSLWAAFAAGYKFRESVEKDTL